MTKSKLILSFPLFFIFIFNIFFESKANEITPPESSVLDEEKVISEGSLKAKEQGEAEFNLFVDTLFLKATDASVRGDSKLAVVMYKHVLSAVPQDQLVARRYIVELVKVGEIETALNVLKPFYEKNKGDAYWGALMGGILTALEKNKEAQIVYENYLKSHPNDDEACVFLAKSYVTDHQEKKAYRLLDQCQMKLPKKGLFSYYKGKIALGSEKRDLALGYFKESLKRQPTFYQSALGMGLIYEEKKNYDEAAKVYRDYLKHDEDQFTILGRFVQILFSQGKFNEALTYAEKLINLDPSDLNLKVRLGILYTDAKRFEEAKKIFEDILVVIPDSDKILYYLGALYQQTGELDKAVETFSKIPEDGPLFHEGHLQIGHILNAKVLDLVEEKGLEASESKLAQKEFLSLVNRLKSRSVQMKVEVSVLAAGHFEALGDLKTAISWLKEVKEEKEFDENQQYYLATLLDKSGFLDEARDIARQILVKTPENAHAMNFLGYSFLEKGENMAEAYDLISKAVKLKPNDGYIRDSLGWYYYKTGNYQKAIEELKKAVEITQGDVIVTKHLAMAYGVVKQYELAKKYFLNALKNCKVQSERKEVIEAMQNFEMIRIPASLSEEI